MFVILPWCRDCVRAYITVKHCYECFIPPVTAENVTVQQYSIVEFAVLMTCLSICYKCAISVQQHCTTSPLNYALCAHYIPLHTACCFSLIPRLTEILIKLADALSLHLLHWRGNDHTPTSVLCCLLTNNRNLFFIKLSGLGTIRV